ncbi:uncharacterized protein LOC113374848 [Ctenocephalides felis]|uniref:uncharacterized protein LOC113374848 n=1 Tax=Ctenocephalides felis TaxID=7515 RepID=UPI000E6E4CF5|nr:uncharacterized protein LOC113374848 [Ctenocephalides felis]
MGMVRIVSQYTKQEFMCLLTDTLSLQNLISARDDHFYETRMWLERINLVVDELVQVGETMRCTLGSLLSVYAVSSSWKTANTTELKLYRDKITELMDGMYPAFESFTGIPFPLINPYENFVEFVDRNEDISHLENFGGIHMEFCYLSRLSKNDKYCETAETIRKIVLRNRDEIEIPNIFHIENKDYRRGVCPLGSCFHRQLINSSPTRYTTYKLFKTLQQGFEKAKAADLITFYALLSMEAKKSMFTDVAEMILYSYEAGFTDLYYINKQGVMEKPAPNAIQRDAILAQSYFYVYRATSENKYKEYCRIIIDNLKNVVKHRQAQGLDWSYQEARHIMKNHPELSVLHTLNNLRPDEPKKSPVSMKPKKKN